MEAEPPEEAPPPPGPGPLQRQLRAGEFGLLRRCRVFESDFLQVGRRGEVLDVHNRARVVTVGVARTSPALPAPNVLLLARPRAPPPAAGVELTRLLPLRWVQVSVQDAPRERLRLRLASGRSFYLQLCPRPGAPGLFERWARLARALRPHAEAPRAAPLPEAAAEREAEAAPSGSGEEEEEEEKEAVEPAPSAPAPRSPTPPRAEATPPAGTPPPGSAEATPPAATEATPPACTPPPIGTETLPPAMAEATPPAGTEAPPTEAPPRAGRVRSSSREPLPRKPSHGRRPGRLAAMMKLLSAPRGGKR